MNLGQVVQHRHQLPLTINLIPSSQAEPSQADILPQVAEDRLDDPQALTVDVASVGGVDLLFHANERIVICLGEDLLHDIDLPGAFLFRAA